MISISCFLGQYPGTEQRFTLRAKNLAGVPAQHRKAPRAARRLPEEFFFNNSNLQDLSRVPP
jgi:hypothetical protein